MTQIKPLPINPLASKEMKGEKKENDNEMNLAFMKMFQAQGEGMTLNIKELLNQNLKEGAITNPKISGLLGKLSEKIIGEMKNLTGKPIHHILSDKKISSEAKALSLIAATLQLKGKVQPNLIKEIKSQALPNKHNETTRNNEVTHFKEPLKKIEQLLKEMNNTSNQKELFNRLTRVLTKEVAVGPNTGEQSINFPNKETGRLITNKPILKKVITEGQNYGEFKLDRGATPTIQLNTADPPQQTQQKFMNQLESILKSARFSHIAKNQTQMTIQLRPDNLGFMTIKVEQVNQELIARIITSSTATKELLESNLQQLRHLNIQVDKFEVSTQQSNQSTQEQEQSKQEQRANQEDQQDDNEQPSQSFEEQLANILP